MVDAAFHGLTSARVRLRRFRDADAAPLAAYRSDPEVARFQSWASFSEQEARELIAFARRRNPGVPGEWFQLAIAIGPTQALIGDLGLHVLEAQPTQAEIGFTLAAAHQGRGYATEAVERLLEYLFERLRMHRVAASTDIDNRRSIALLERLGMRRDGASPESEWLKGQWRSQHRYAILEREWRRRGR